MPEWDTGLLIVIGLAAVAIALIVRTRMWKKRAVSVAGKIVGFSFMGEGKGSRRVPVIEFHTREGEQTRFRTGTRTMFDSFSVGDELPVVYDPDKPARAKIDRAGHLYAVPKLIIFVAVVIAFVTATQNPEIMARIEDFINR